MEDKTLDINTHHQNEAFEDGDHDMIEDLSVDKELEAQEKKEKDETKEAIPEYQINGPSETGLPDGLAGLLN